MTQEKLNQLQSEPNELWTSAPTRDEALDKLAHDMAELKVKIEDIREMIVLGVLPKLACAHDQVTDIAAVVLGEVETEDGH